MENEKYHWSFLENLAVLPHPNREKIDTAKYAVFLQNDHGILYEAYRTEEKTEAEELLKFLNSLNPTYKYWIDKPEPLAQTWIVTRIAPAETDKIVARYTGRSMTEECALRMSKADEAFYQAREEYTGQSGLTFFKGAISS